MEDRGALEKDLQRHCAVVYADPEEDRHFAEEGRVAEFTVDLVLQGRAKMPNKKSTGQKIPS